MTSPTRSPVPAASAGAEGAAGSAVTRLPANQSRLCRAMSRIGDIAAYPLCWAAYRLVLLLPTDWRLPWRLLPWAGLYAYSDTFRNYLDARDWGRARRTYGGDQ